MMTRRPAGAPPKAVEKPAEKPKDAVTTESKDTDKAQPEQAPQTAAETVGPPPDIKQPTEVVKPEDGQAAGHAADVQDASRAEVVQDAGHAPLSAEQINPDSGKIEPPIQPSPAVEEGRTDNPQ